MTSWSGGKDSCFALMKAKEQGLVPSVILNMMNEKGMVSRSHAIPKAILQEQGAMLGLPLITQPASWDDYEKVFIETLRRMKHEFHIDTAVFGDIDLQAHRDWEEKVCRATDLKAMLPLWKRDRRELVFEMIDEGIETYIVSCNDHMGKDFLGQRITRDLISKLEAIDVDPCGENGEYHTLVVDSPVFSNRINVAFGNCSDINNYWFVDMKLD